MTSNNILKLAVKFLGVYFLAKGLFSMRGISLWLSYAINAEAPDSHAGIAWIIASSVFMTVFYLIIGILALKYAHVFISKVFSHDNTNILIFTPQTNKLLFSVCVIIMGILYLIYSVPSVFSSICDYFKLLSSAGDFSAPLAFWDEKLKIIQSLLFLLFSLTLIFHEKIRRPKHNESLKQT